MADSGPTLTFLAKQISDITATITTYLEEKKLTAPSFAADSPTSFPEIPPELFHQRQVLLDAINDLAILVQGPSESVFNYVHTAAPDVAALNVLNYFDFWAAVPLDGSASYDEIAEHVKLPVDVVTRILLHSTNLRLFAETEPGKRSTRIQHSSRSAAVAKNAGLKSLIQAVLDDAGPPTTILHEALQRYSRGSPEFTQEQKESAFALLHSGGAYNGHTNYFEYQESGDGWRSKSYTKFMGYLKEIFHMENLVLDLKDWRAVGKASVVDVGGSAGHDAVVLAQNFPDLALTVQDLPKVRTQFEATVPPDLKSRISFSEHNFLEPQPVQADIYLLKMILHDWADADAIKILKALIPALKPGARVVLLEYIGDRGETETPLPLSMRQWGTATDLRLMALFNTKERQVDAWKRLFNAADERFEVAEVSPKPEDFFAVVEATWRG